MTYLLIGIILGFAGGLILGLWLETPKNRKAVKQAETAAKSLVADADVRVKDANDRLTSMKDQNREMSKKLKRGN